MVVGHQKQWQFLKKSAELGKISHAYLFVGQEQLGKKTLAIEFIKWLFNEDIRERQHPDFIFIEPKKTDKTRIVKEEIQISQIRELIRRLSLKPFRAPFKTAIIDQAHCMNQEAQNCFLKTLEEPKGKTLLILITEYPEILLPTICSRCEIIKFYPVEKIEIKKYLENQGIPNQQTEEIARISMGRPGLSRDFISDPQKLENQRKTIKDLIRISNSELSARFQYAKNLSQEPQLLKEILDIWLRYFRNEFLKTAISSQKSTKNNSQFNNYSLAKLSDILKLIQRTNSLITTTNVNPRLALEILMLEL